VRVQLVGELDLVEGVLKQLLLQPLGPGARQLMFVENAEAHG